MRTPLLLLALAATCLGQNIARGTTFTIEGPPASSSAVNPRPLADGTAYAYRVGGRVYVFDRTRETITTVSVSAIGGSIDKADARGADVSDDGRYVAYHSSATNVVPFDTNGEHDVFVRDRKLRINIRASVSTTLQQGNGPSTWPRISASGRYVVFQSASTNLVPSDPNGKAQDVYLRDLVANTIIRLGTTRALDTSHACHILGDSYLCYRQTIPASPKTLHYILRYEIAKGATTTVAQTLSQCFISRDGVSVAYRKNSRAEVWRNGITTQGPVATGDPIISPNGRFLAYYRSTTVGPRIFIWDTLKNIEIAGTVDHDGSEIQSTASFSNGGFAKCDKFILITGRGETLPQGRSMFFACYPYVGIDYPSLAKIGGSATIRVVSDPSFAGKSYGLAHSYATRPSISIPGDEHRTIPLTVDFPLLLSITNQAIFQKYVGLCDANGTGTGTLKLPNLYSLVGFQFYCAGIIYDATGIIGISPARLTRFTL